jgi:hypothetical protein
MEEHFPGYRILETELSRIGFLGAFAPEFAFVTLLDLERSAGES